MRRRIRALATRIDSAARTMVATLNECCRRRRRTFGAITPFHAASQTSRGGRADEIRHSARGAPYQSVVYFDLCLSDICPSRETDAAHDTGLRAGVG
jgi:hypothetical protein